MKRQIIRLTEEDLHNIIRNVVTETIRENQENEWNLFSKGKDIEYASPETRNYQKNYKSKVIDNCDGTYNDINNYNKDEKGVRESRMQEGVGNWLKGAAIGGAMALSPMHGNAQTAPTDSIDNDSTEMMHPTHMYIEDIVHEIEENTDSNYIEIEDFESQMMERNDLAAQVIGSCFQDEPDNLKTLGERDVNTLSEQDFEKLEEAIDEGKTLVTITCYDDGKPIPNCIIDLETLRQIMNQYDTQYTTK